MRHLLNRDKLNTILEGFTIKSGSTIWIHHPITEDLISVNVVQAQRDRVLVSVPENSPYRGQPDWWVKKIHVIGINDRTPK